MNNVGSLKKSFDAYRDKCMTFVEQYWSNPPPFESLLTHRIKDPIKAYRNQEKVWVVRKEIEKIKEFLYCIYYKDYGAKLFRVPFWTYLSSHLPFFKHDSKEYCTLSPEYLQNKGGWQKGDELWEWNTPKETWDNLCGVGGYCIVRDDKIVWKAAFWEN